MAEAGKAEMHKKQENVRSTGPQPKGPGGKGLRGPKPKIKNPGKLFARLMKYIFANYKFHIIFVAVGILVGVFANVQGTLFMQTLIDDYVLPLMGTEHPDFGPLTAAIGRVGVIYGMGPFSPGPITG